MSREVIDDEADTVVMAQSDSWGSPEWDRPLAEVLFPWPTLQEAAASVVSALDCLLDGQKRQAPTLAQAAAQALVVLVDRPLREAVVLAARKED